MSRHPTLVYTTYRILLFAAALGVLYLLGARDLLLVVLAVLVSGLISFVVLAKQRDAMSAIVAARVQKVKNRIDASAAAEDDDNSKHGS